MDPCLSEHVLCDCRVGYAVADRALRVTAVGGAVSVLSDHPEAWLGRSLIDLVPELVGSEPALSDILAGDLPRLEMAWINRDTADGRTQYLTMIDLPNRDAEGQVVGLLHAVYDDTEAGILKQELSQHRNELRLTQERLARQNLDLAAANTELQRLNELKSTFVSVAAHELRTPLAVIQGYVEMLVDEDVGPLNERQHEYLDFVQDSAQRLANITVSLLDVTRIEAGRLDLVLQPTDLPALVQRVAAEFEPQLAAKRQHLRLHHAPDLPPALCDPIRTPHIVSNLMSNAYKYTPPAGHIFIAVDLAQEEGFLQLTVADDGIGIAPEDHGKLFERFFRAASAARAGASGAGLSLYITRALVELHGGRIWLESAVDKGSTFFVTLPTAA